MTDPTPNRKVTLQCRGCDHEWKTNRDWRTLYD